MSFKIREFYYYAVCFVTLIMCIFAITGLVNTIADMFFPYPPYTPSKIELLKNPKVLESDISDNQKIQQWVEEEQQMIKERETQQKRHQIARDFSRSISFLLVAFPIYLYHWRRVIKFES
ncbi:MAG: hypothetical protein KAX49_19525 [Halanaerobiales bacterium]|nr:hypothetical protein [Halanaerobiales bacterium]